MPWVIIWKFTYCVNIIIFINGAKMKWVKKFCYSYTYLYFKKNSLTFDLLGNIEI